MSVKFVGGLLAHEQVQKGLKTSTTQILNSRTILFTAQMACQGR
jgi:hypothetical protein